MSRTRSCPACFRLRIIPELIPVCGVCAKLIPKPLQSAFGSAVLAGDRKKLAALSATIVEAVSNELDRRNLRALDRELAKGAR